MASSDPWADYETLRHTIRLNTVDRLKQIVNGLNEECFLSLSKSGRKQELIDRVVDVLARWKMENNVDRWNKARTVINQVRTSGMYTPSSGPRSFTAAAAATNYGIPNNVKPYGHVTQPATSTTIGRYDAYAPPRRPGPSTSTVASTSSGPPTIRFKPSPFIRVERSVSAVVECPESASATDRRSQTLSFYLTNEHISKLNSASPKYQLRLFCTSSMFYSSGLNSFKTHSGPCPIEFPPTCEIRVNNGQISANTKGLKKKPGTAPPADLGRTVKMTPQSQNRVELIYVNSQQPAQPKKFFMVVNLVEVTNVDQLVEKVRKGKYKSSDEIMAKMKAAISEDDDIVAGPQKMSLKCPLSYMRITTPCRSSQCVHSQCFDAMSWFSVMEQTTTYMCPVCERVLNADDLIMDGYFDGILKESPESVEDVIVEADGEWHTSDNKYGSAAWKRAHPPVAPKPAMKLPASPVKTNGASSSDLNGKKKANVEIVVLDSDDEDDEGQVKRELSPSIGSGSSVLVPPSESPSLGGRSQTQTDVIDLTLSDSDEEDPRPPPSSRAAEKRKAPDNGIPSPTEQIWKKSRVESVVPPPIVKNINGQHVNGAGATSNSLNAALSPNTTHRPFYDPLRGDPTRDPMRDLPRVQPPAYASRPPSIPRVPSGGRYSSSEATYHSFLGSNSPPPPPPRRHPSTSSGGQMASRPGGRDFYNNSSSSRWS